MLTKSESQENKDEDLESESPGAQTDASKNMVSKLVDKNRDVTLFFRVVKTKSEVYDIISRAFSRKQGWSELPHGLDLRNSWNFMWSWSKITMDVQRLLVFQKVNHFTGNKNVSRKDFLKRNIERAQNMSAKANQVFNIMPLTFISAWCSPNIPPKSTKNCLHFQIVFGSYDILLKGQTATTNNLVRK